MPTHAIIDNRKEKLVDHINRILSSIGAGRLYNLTPEDWRSPKAVAFLHHAGDSRCPVEAKFSSTVREQAPQRVARKQFEFQGADGSGFRADLKHFGRVLEGFAKRVEVQHRSGFQFAPLGVKGFGEDGGGHQQSGGKALGVLLHEKVLLLAQLMRVRARGQASAFPQFVFENQVGNFLGECEPGARQVDEDFFATTIIRGSRAR